MLKSNQYKAYGSIRKTKVAGACGVILALGILGMGLQGTVSADEVSTDKTVAVEKKTELEVPISHENLDKAVTEAKNAGVNVEVGAVKDKGVATSETVAEKKKEIEDSAKQGIEQAVINSELFSKKIREEFNTTTDAFREEVNKAVSEFEERLFERYVNFEFYKTLSN